MPTNLVSKKNLPRVRSNLKEREERSRRSHNYYQSVFLISEVVSFTGSISQTVDSYPPWLTLGLCILDCMWPAKLLILTLPKTGQIGSLTHGHRTVAIMTWQGSTKVPPSYILPEAISGLKRI